MISETANIRVIEDESHLLLDTPAWRAWMEAARKALGPRNYSTNAHQSNVFSAPSHAGKSVITKDDGDE